MDGEGRGEKVVVFGSMAWSEVVSFLFLVGCGRWRVFGWVTVWLVDEVELKSVLGSGVS